MARHKDVRALAERTLAWRPESLERWGTRAGTGLPLHVLRPKVRVGVPGLSAAQPPAWREQAAQIDPWMPRPARLQLEVIPLRSRNSGWLAYCDGPPFSPKVREIFLLRV